MKINSPRFILEENNENFQYEKNNTINFNRIAFIFFVFFIITLIFSIHLLHLGTRKSQSNQNIKHNIINKNHRADIIDRNGNYLAKTVSSIDIGINPTVIIDQKKLLINLKYIFPGKN